MKFLTKLRLWQKFAVLGVLAVVLVSVPTYQFVRESFVAINFSKSEEASIAPLRILGELLAVNHRVRTQADGLIPGTDADRSANAALQARADAAMKGLQPLLADPMVGNAKSRETWERFQPAWAEWYRRLADRSQPVTEGDAKRKALASQLFEVMDAVADQTLLTLDPDIDSYYLHRIGVYRMPQLAEDLVRLRDEGIGFLAAAEATRNPTRVGMINAGDRARLLSIVERAQERRQSIATEELKTIGYTPDIGTRLDEPMRAALAAVQKATQLTTAELIEREAPGYSVAQYAKAYNEAIDQVHKANVVVINELDGVIVKRIGRLETRQLEVLIAIGLLILLGAVTGLLIVRSVTMPMSHLVRVMQRVRSGEAAARAQIDTSDEVGTLAKEFDQMMDDREAVNTGIREENERINNSVLELLQTVAKLAGKDLTAKAPVAEDVTGAVADALNMLTRETAGVLLRVTDVAAEVAKVSEQVKEQSDSVMATARSERNEVQVAARELTDASQNMQSIAQLAQDCNDAAQRAITTTRTALESVGATVDSIGTIRDTVRETEKRIKRLGERSQEISSVVNLINTISERTHILALNAAMHAASAGEAGRGFAVVAGEVQRLAENAREATSQIATLVQNIQVETSDTVSKMNEVITQVVGGSQLAEQAGQQMRDTEASTTNLVRMVEDITSGSKAQAATSAALKDRAARIEKSTEITGSELQEQTVHTTRLVEFAGKLMEAVTVFKLPERKADVVEIPPRRAA
jgi:methyl-accepting chemotaxis protein